MSVGGVPSPMQNQYFECCCNSDEHTLKFVYDPDDGEVYTSTFIRHWRPWWKRVWVAMKYVFGYTSKYGHFDCTIIRFDDLERLQELISAARNTQAALMNEKA